MVKLTHTKGPWKYVRGQVLTEDETYTICDSGDWGGYISDADAQLIACAPEMLEELKSILRYKDNCPYCEGSGEPQNESDRINERCENCSGMGYVVLPSMACDFSFIEKLISKATNAE